MLPILEEKEKEVRSRDKRTRKRKKYKKEGKYLLQNSKEPTFFGLFFFLGKKVPNLALNTNFIFQQTGCQKGEKKKPTYIPKRSPPDLTQVYRTKFNYQCAQNDGHGDDFPPSRDSLTVFVLTLKLKLVMYLLLYSLQTHVMRDSPINVLGMLGTWNILGIYHCTGLMGGVSMTGH